MNEKLDSDELVQLRQRVRLRFHLTALGEADSVQYSLHRLRVAGAGDRQIFEPATFPVIYRYAGGIPRLLNTLCDTALIAAFAQDRETVSVEEIQSAVSERAGGVDYAYVSGDKLHKIDVYDLGTMVFRKHYRNHCGYAGAQESRRLHNNMVSANRLGKQLLYPAADDCCSIV